MSDATPTVKNNFESAIAVALGLAEEAAKRDEVPVGAIVLDSNGQIIGRGANDREQTRNPLRHAEMIAIEEAAGSMKSWRLTGCTLVVTLEPCLMCLAAAQQARIGHVVFAAKDPKGGALSLGHHFHEDTRLNHRFTVEYLETPACGEVLSRFFKQKRLNKVTNES